MKIVDDGCARCVRCGLVFQGREVIAEEHTHTPKGPMHFYCNERYVRALQGQKTDA